MWGSKLVLAIAGLLVVLFAPLVVNAWNYEGEWKTAGALDSLKERGVTYIEEHKTFVVAEDDRCVVAGTREVARERQRGVVPRPRRRSSLLEAIDALARQLVRPRARFAGWLVRAMKAHHDVARGRLAQNRLVAIDHLLRLVIEEIDFRADDAERPALVDGY